MNGYSDGRFGVNDPLTRGQFIKVLHYYNRNFTEPLQRAVNDARDLQTKHETLQEQVDDIEARLAAETLQQQITSLEARLANLEAGNATRATTTTTPARTRHICWPVEGTGTTKGQFIHEYLVTGPDLCGRYLTPPGWTRSPSGCTQLFNQHKQTIQAQLEAQFRDHINFHNPRIPTPNTCNYIDPYGRGYVAP